MIRVLILADSSVRAESLAEMLSEESNIEVLAADPAHNQEEHDTTFADVVVYAGLDIEWMDTIALPTVVLAGTNSEPHWPAPVRAWLPLDTEPSELIAAIGAAAQNLTVLTPAQAPRWLPAHSAVPAISTAEEELTRREREVLRLLADGLGNKEIAALLHISEHTAKSHVSQILGKLGAGSRTEAVAQGIRRGLVPL